MHCLELVFFRSSFHKHSIPRCSFGPVFASGNTRWKLSRLVRTTQRPQMEAIVVQTYRAFLTGVSAPDMENVEFKPCHFVKLPIELKLTILDYVRIVKSERSLLTWDSWKTREISTIFRKLVEHSNGQRWLGFIRPSILEYQLTTALIGALEITLHCDSMSSQRSKTSLSEIAILLKVLRDATGGPIQLSDLHHPMRTRWLS